MRGASSALSDAAGNAHGFLRDRGGRFTRVDVPGSAGTWAWGINGAGQIVGEYVDAAGGGRHGFLGNGHGVFTTVDVPGATSTTAYGINRRGHIVGEYQDASGNHGFLAEPWRASRLSVNGGTSCSESGWL